MKCSNVLLERFIDQFPLSPSHLTITIEVRFSQTGCNSSPFGAGQSSGANICGESVWIFGQKEQEDKMTIWKKWVGLRWFVFSVWKVMFIPISLLFPLFIPFFLSQSLSFPFSPFNIFFTDLSQSFSPAVHPPNVFSPSHWRRLVTEKYSAAICTTCIAI